MQFLADILNVPVERPVVTETTALGAAMCAGLGVGLFSSTDEVAQNWQSDRVFRPQMKDEPARPALCGLARGGEAGAKPEPRLAVD